jgi:hypothetical protein
LKRLRPENPRKRGFATLMINSLDQLFAANYDHLIAWCRGLGPGGLSDAEDIVHGAYLRSRDGYQAPCSSSDRPLAYVRQAIRWELADHRRGELRRVRRERRLAQERQEWHELTPDGLVAATESVPALCAQQREVCLAILAGKRPDELSREFRLSKSALAVCLCRARRSLVKLLG